MVLYINIDNEEKAYTETEVRQSYADDGAVSRRRQRYFDYGIGLLSVRRAQLRAGRRDGVLGYRRWIDFSRGTALELAAAEDFRSVAQCKTWASVRVAQR